VKARILLIAALAFAAACSESSAPERAAETATPAAAQTRPAASETPAAATATQVTETAASEAAAAARSQPERIELAQASGGADPLAGFTEGTHYVALSPVQPTSSGPDVVEVAEFFMYSCIHCYNFEPYVQQWLTTKPDFINFVRVPTVWNPTVRLHAQAFYAAEALGKGEEMHAPFFREMHVNGNYLQSKDAIASFFGQFDVDRDTFEGAFESFAVHAKLQRADELGRRYRVDATPTIVVNGKYRTNASMAGGYDQLLELINALAESERTTR